MDTDGMVPQPGATTGRTLVLFEDGATPAGMQMVEEAMRPGAGAAGEEAMPAGPGVRYFESLGVAVVDAPPEQVQQAGVSTAEASIAIVEPERIVYALEATHVAGPATNGHAAIPIPDPPPFAAPAPPRAGPFSAEYLRGYREAVLHLTAGIATDAAAGAQAIAAALDETQATWGLQATKVVNCCRTGKGVRVAVLDTGFDLTHPDFAGRTITTKSFITGEEVQDGHGHGTHCIGTATGAKCPPTLPRYGIAYEAEIYAGKVLSNAGSGGDAGILAGIEWALENQCAVISMSLGARTSPGQRPSAVFERVAKRVLEAGTLIVAAAGNESARPGTINPVGHPANCPSILAVAAVDVDDGIARFSNRGINADGGQVDIAGPGVAVHSSWIMPLRYRSINGTSMATPHVAGIAALYAEADPAARGATLWTTLTGRARRMELPSSDVGAGLVQAP
jgi:hypothetical protein